MDGTEQQGSGRLAYSRWDALTVVALGTILLAASWLDVHSYFHHRNQARPDFAFLDAAADEHLGTEDELYRGNQCTAVLENIGQLENDGRQRFRHGLGPRSTILVWANRSHALLDVQFNNAVADQEITVSCDGRVVERLTHQPELTVDRRYALDLLPGRNEVTVDFARYNGAGVELSREDTRPMAGTFTRLEITLR